MAIFYLIRHGKTDYSERNKKFIRDLGCIYLRWLQKAFKRSKVPRKTNGCAVPASSYLHRIQELCKQPQFSQKSSK